MGSLFGRSRSRWFDWHGVIGLNFGWFQWHVMSGSSQAQQFLCFLDQHLYSLPNLVNICSGNPWTR